MTTPLGIKRCGAGRAAGVVKTADDDTYDFDVSTDGKVVAVKEAADSGLGCANASPSLDVASYRMAASNVNDGARKRRTVVGWTGTNGQGECTLGSIHPQSDQDWQWAAAQVPSRTVSF
jgi:hypothetical protein